MTNKSGYARDIETGPSRILLVEDNSDDVELCQRLLKKAYPRAICDVVQSKEEFSHRLRASEYDVILADYQLGSWTGLDAFHLMQQYGRDIPFILVTGALGDERAIECIKSGITDYILKSNPERLPVAISRAVLEKKVLDERQQAEFALEQRDSQLRMLVEAIPAATFVQQGTRCCYVNRAAETITGYSRRELLSMTFWDLILPDSRKALIGLANPHAENKPTYRYEIEILTKQGELRYLDVTVAMFQNDGGLAALITAFDISERIRREIAERRHVDDQARQSRKMEALGQLSGGVAHDFNNLLGVIIGYGECLQEQVEQSNPLRASVDQILNASMRAASLTRQLLAFSRLQMLESKALDIRSVVLKMKELLDRLVTENIEIITMLGEAPLIVRADEGQLEQVIMNLAVNARDAMPTGGQLIIKTEEIVIDEASVRTYPYPVQIGPYVCLSVTDNGIGMDAETKVRAFEPFFTTKDNGKGTGLGLSTVYGVVKQSGGHIEILSAPGAGATFKVFLPRFDESPATTKRLLTERVAASSAKETVLLAEDEPFLRTLIRNTLEESGYSVLEAKDGMDALKVAQAYDGSIDLLVSDVVMPEMGGRVLSQRLAHQRPGIGIMYISGYPGHLVDTIGPYEEASVFLAKPFTRDALIRKVREALDAPVSLRNE